MTVQVQMFSVGYHLDFYVIQQAPGFSYVTATLKIFQRSIPIYLFVTVQ